MQKQNLAVIMHSPVYSCLCKFSFFQEAVNPAFHANIPVIFETRTAPCKTACLADFHVVCDFKVPLGKFMRLGRDSILDQFTINLPTFFTFKASG